MLTKTFPQIRIIFFPLLLFASFCCGAEKSLGFSLNQGLDLTETVRWDAFHYMNRGLSNSLTWDVEMNIISNLMFAENQDQDNNNNVDKNNLIAKINEAFEVWKTAAKNDPFISDLVRFSNKGGAVEASPSDGSGLGNVKLFNGAEISFFARPENYTLLSEENKPENVFQPNEIANARVTALGLSDKNRNALHPRNTGNGFKRHNVGKTIVDADIYLNSSLTWTLDQTANPNAKDFGSSELTL